MKQAFVLTGILALALSLPAQSGGPAKPSFDNYRVVYTRNIFNSGRRAPAPSGGSSRQTESVAPTIETITLSGTLLRDTGNLAIFSSAVQDESGARSEGGSVAGFQIKSIATTSVTLEKDGKSLTWQVGGILRRLDGGEWYLPEAAAAATDITADPAAEAAILKRMRARRAQEAK